MRKKLSAFWQIELNKYWWGSKRMEAIRRARNIAKLATKHFTHIVKWFLAIICPFAAKSVGGYLNGYQFFAIAKITIYFDSFCKILSKSYLKISVIR